MVRIPIAAEELKEYRDGGGLNAFFRGVPLRSTITYSTRGAISKQSILTITRVYVRRSFTNGSELPI